MKYLPPPIERLVGTLSKLPGIGERTAMRLAFHILDSPDGYARELASHLVQMKEQVRSCGACFNLTEADPCAVCASRSRDGRQLCVVETPQDMMAVEATNEFKGKYHVLHGVISPLEGVGPDRLKIKELLERLPRENVAEVLVATNPSVEGEATALYLAKLIRPLGVRVTRLASGIPMGGDLEYVDHMTLSRAIAGRKELG